MDLIADVMQQADASKLRTATLRLKGIADSKLAVADGATFKNVGDLKNLRGTEHARATNTGKDQSRLSGVENNDVATQTRPSDGSKKAAMRGLETILATKMVESMMPKDQSDIYGKGTAGEIWRGFHIDQMGKALASKGLFGPPETLTTDIQSGFAKASRQKKIVPFAG